uniref:immunoglobulin superfamily member 10-like isoform X3 n=1 Tax=Myxine glutinosa TaxID=7769 RepID=UPI00358E40B8
MRQKILDVWRKFVNSSTSWKLLCEVEARPRPNITWWNPQGLLNGSEIQINLNEQNGLQKIIRSYRITGEVAGGNYSCLVQNQHSAAKEFVFAKPQILSLYKSLRPNIQEIWREIINSGTTWMLFCEAEAKPRPNITWWNPQGLLLNGSEIIMSPNNQNELQKIISSYNITGEDPEGNYSCLVQNQHGAVIGYTFYKSLHPKILNVWKEFIPSSTSWRLVCEAEAKPGPQITWWNPQGLLLNGSETIASPMNQSEFQKIITTYNIAGEDPEGKYSCVVWSQYGTAKGHVVYKSLCPKILRTWKEFVSSSTSWKLFCEAEAMPGPNITWWNPQGLLLNRSETTVNPINQTEFEKIFSSYNITGEDPEGNYSCVVRSQYGTAKGHVVYKSLCPKILRTWKEFVSSSTSWKLFCEAEAMPGPNITWWNPQGLLLNRSETTVNPINQTEFDKIFSNYNITGEDLEGNYSCVVRSQYGTAKGHVVYKSLHPKILAIWREFQNSSKSWKLFCETEVKLGRNIITWWNPRGLLLNGSEILVISSDKIDVQKIINSYNITEEDPEGNYSCLVRNQYGATKGFVFYKSLHPTILHIWREFVHSSTSWRLFCKAESKRRQNVTWWNPQGRLLNGNNIVVSARDQNHIQEIVNVYEIKEEDPEGNYSCLVQNEHGAVKGFVYYKSMRPKILRVWREFLNSSCSWRLLCEVEAKPRPNITWWHPQGLLNGSEILVSSNNYNEFQKIISSYNLTKEDTEGNYSCVVHNEYGAVKKSVFHVESKKKSGAQGITGSVLGGSIASILVIVLLLVVWVYYIYKKQPNPSKEAETQGLKHCSKEEAFPMSPSLNCTTLCDLDRTSTPVPIQ